MQLRLLVDRGEYGCRHRDVWHLYIILLGLGKVCAIDLAGYITCKGASTLEAMVPVTGGWEKVMVSQYSNYACAINQQDQLHCWGFVGPAYDFGQIISVDANDLSTFPGLQPPSEAGTLAVGFDAGEQIECEVEVTYGSDAPVSDSATTTINRPPMIGWVDIDIALNVGSGVTNTYTCYANDYQDPDGDPDRSIVNWYVSGSLVQSDNNVLTYTTYTGDEVECEFIPFDGTSEGLPMRYALPPV